VARGGGLTLRETGLVWPLDSIIAVYCHDAELLAARRSSFAKSDLCFSRIGASSNPLAHPRNP